MSAYLRSRATMTQHESQKTDLSRQPRSIGMPQRIADCDLATKEKIRQKVKMDIFVNPAPQMPFVFYNMSAYSFLLPVNWGLHPPGFVTFLESILIDQIILEYFEFSKIINWSSITTKLYPLKTTGDGNCLMHAISLFLWGVEDLDLQMRRVLYQDIFSDSAVKQYKKRWQLGRAAYDQGIPSAGLRYDTMNWDDEWKLVIRNSSPEPAADGQAMLPFHSLEEIHIFIMANILRRPIIVLADRMFRNCAGLSLQPQNVTGIYLPVISKPEVCCKDPITLGYHQNHFVPLISKKLLPEEQLEIVLPMCTKNFEGFPIHFLLPEEDASKEILLKNYLSQKQLTLSGSSQTMCMIMAAKLGVKEFPESVNIMETFIKSAEKQYQRGSQVGQPPNTSVGAAVFSPKMKKPGQTRSAKICLMCEKYAAEGDNDVCQECLMKNCTSFHPSASAPPESMPISAMANQLSKLNMAGVRTENELRGPPLNPSYSSPTVSTFQPFLNQQQVDRQGYSIQVEKPCKTPRCQFYCSSQVPGDYCHDCSKKRPIGHYSNNLEQCRTVGCFNAANLERQGLCDICSETQHHKKYTPPQIVGYQQINSTTEFNSAYQGRTGLVPGKKSIVQDPSGLDSLAILQTSVGYKKCLEPNCRLTGQDNLNGFCRSCYNKNMKMQQHVGIDPQIKLQFTAKQNSLEEVKFKQNIMDPKLCRADNCKLFGTEEQQGYCTKCLNDSIFKETEKKMICKNPMCDKKVFKDNYCQVCFEHTPNLGSSKAFGVQFQTASLVEPNQNHGGLETCITKGCDRLVVISGDGRRCYDCYQSQQLQSQHMEQQLAKCVNPNCHNKTPRDNPLCNTCQGVLNAKSSERMNAGSVAPGDRKKPCSRCCQSKNGVCISCLSENKRRCRTEGCEMYGTLENQSYCSNCCNTKSIRSWSAPIIPSPNMLAKHEPHKNRRCANGCGNWANTQVLEGLCNECYKVYNDYSGTMTPTANVQENVTELRNMNRTDQRCFAPDCLNYGNPASKGFCNSCFRNRKM